MKRSVLISLVLMAVSNFSFALLAVSGHSNIGMAGAIGFENIASGIGGVCVVAYFSALCDLRFTAAQYALISAAASIVGRFLTGTTAGALIDAIGYVNFYLLTTAARGARDRAVLDHDAHRADRPVDRQRRVRRERRRPRRASAGGNRQAGSVRDLIVRREHRAGEIERAEDQDPRAGGHWPQAPLRHCRARRAAKPSWPAISTRSLGAKQAWSGIGNGMDLGRETAERLEHARRVLGGEAGEDEVQRLPVREAVLGEGRDLPRRRRIVAAVEPDFAFAHQRPRREMLEPRGPVRPAHRSAQRRGRHIAACPGGGASRPRARHSSPGAARAGAAAASSSSPCSSR